MGPQVYYLKTESGRVTVMRPQPNSAPFAVASCLALAQATSLCETLNGFVQVIDEMTSALKRERSRVNMFATYMHELVESQRCEEGQTPSAEQMLRNGKAIVACLQLLEVFQPRGQTPPERAELLEQPPEASGG